MSAIIMDGKALANQIKDDLKKEIEQYAQTPRLAIIANKDDAASAVYLRNKEKDCAEVGIDCQVHYLNSTEVIPYLKGLNVSPCYHGIICQLPLVDGVSEKEVLNTITKNKDVDGFASDDFDPCTPLGIMELLKHYNIEVAGKHCIVVGRSNIVGRPMAKMLIDADGTVTVCHSKTKNLAECTKQADILIVATGRRNLITADMIKDGAVVIDVGINRDENGKLCGDVDFDTVAEKASFITPVPGGVGPMTRAMLLVNTAKAFKNLQKST